jgi:hypothetical protein
MAPLTHATIKRIVWSKANSRITPLCSLCQGYIEPDTVPLMIWDWQLNMAHFCERCIDELFNKRAP